jgi:hypothetical protein
VKRESQLELKSAFLKPYTFIAASILQIIFNNALVTKFGLFWAAAYAKTPEAIAEKIELIQLENESAYSYLLAIEKKLWTRAYQPYPK